MQTYTQSIIISPQELGSIFRPTLLKLGSPSRADRRNACKALWDFIRSSDLLVKNVDARAELLAITTGSSATGAELLVITFQWNPLVRGTEEQGG